MAKTKSVGSILNKLGEAARKAFNKHKDDETTLPSGGDLPSGINNGVAKLVECKFGVYEKGDFVGKPYFMASGVVLAPTHFDGVKVQGLRTSIGPEPICDTAGRKRDNVEEHMTWVLNQLRLLGVDTKELAWEDLEGVMETLKEEQPTFAFRTWASQPNKRYPNPRVNHEWRGVTETTIEETSDDEVEEEEETEAAEESDTEMDVAALAEAADAGDSEAADQLVALCEEHGIDHNAIATWAEVAELIAAGGAEEEEEEAEEEPEEEEEEEAADPSVGDVYLYKKPGTRRSVECEVTAVFAKSQKVNLKNLEDGKTLYKSIPFDKLASS